MKVLCVHGIGRQEATAATWQPVWQDAITHGLDVVNPAGGVPSVEFVRYDDLFEGPLSRLSYRDFAAAFWELTRGALLHPRGLLDFSDSTRWFAGMVVVWVDNDGLRADLRQRMGEALVQYKPDVVCAHSLGSLIAYDTFVHDDSGVRGKTLITLGSQLGNLFVRGGAFAGRVEPLESAARWFHLYNPNDHVFTAPLDFGAFLTAENFQQVVTQFGNYLSGFADNHSAVNPGDPNRAYLTHPQTREVVWPQVAGAPTVRALAVPARAAREVAAAATPDRRALLVGVNAYPDVAQRLEGCVNDVFLMSSVLQECGFAAEDIRVVLDDRATAEGIRERLHWLLDGANGGDTRFFYYSGHGAQLPVYGPQGKIDRVDTCLVPYDFNWTPENAITDRDMVNCYSQLPYDARFMMVLDCCYSGGMTRGGTRVRGLDPPDDVRHRLLRWDAERQMWVPRELPPLNRDLARQRDAAEYVGDNGATLRLGRAVPLRVMPNKEYDRARKELEHKGPYLPMVYEACGEQEFAYEYQHGATAYGAFTYAMAAVLRRRGAAGEALTFAELLKETAKVLKELRYVQQPELAGPRGLQKAHVPWHGAGADGRPASRA
jgi:hypothetical protein